MKTRQLLILALFAGVAHAAPEPLATGIPAFLDTDGDGIISETERQAFVEARKDARAGLLPDWDSDGDGVIDEEEQAAAVATLQSKANEKRLELFSKVAGDDGVLTLDEFSALQPFQNVPAETVAALFALLDADGDGEVSGDDFLARLGGGFTPPTTPPAPPTPPSPPAP
jgi:hypothetical protein